MNDQIKTLKNSLILILLKYNVVYKQKDDVEVDPFPNDDVIEFSLPAEMMDTSTKSSNSDDLESSIKSTSTNGGSKNESIKTTASTTISTPAGKEAPAAAKSTPQSANRANQSASSKSKKK